MAKTPRTLQQIKAQWGIIKMAAKKQKFFERQQRFQTGGGPPPVSEVPSGEDIAVWLPHEFTVDSNEFDSDNQIILENNEKEKKISCENSGLEVAEMCENSGLEVAEMMVEPSTSSKHIVKTKLKPQDEPKNKKIKNSNKNNAVLQIAETETACRKQLHEAQMANEEQTLKNLKLKEQLTKYKLEYYKNKLKLKEEVTKCKLQYYKNKLN